MPAEEPNLRDLTFKQIATATRAKDVELYGLTDDGKVFLLDEEKGYWLPLVMGTPTPEFRVIVHRPKSPTA